MRTKAKCHVGRWAHSDGLCNSCYRKAHYAADTEKHDKYLRKLYGITHADYEKLLKYQEGVCAICSRAPKTRRLNVDHDHKTGKVRGLLCYLCNKGTAFYHDNPVIARKFAEYLENPPWTMLGKQSGQVRENMAAQSQFPPHFRVFELGRGLLEKEPFENPPAHGNPVK